MEQGTTRCNVRVARSADGRVGTSCGETCVVRRRPFDAGQQRPHHQAAAADSTDRLNTTGMGTDREREARVVAPPTELAVAKGGGAERARMPPPMGTLCGPLRHVERESTGERRKRCFCRFRGQGCARQTANHSKQASKSNNRNKGGEESFRHRRAGCGPLEWAGSVPQQKKQRTQEGKKVCWFVSSNYSFHLRGYMYNRHAKKKHHSTLHSFSPTLLAWPPRSLGLVARLCRSHHQQPVAPGAAC